MLTDPIAHPVTVLIGDCHKVKIAETNGMWKPFWAFVLSTAFAIGLTVTPLPERWRMLVVITAWSICAVAAFGWGFSHWREKRAPTRKQPQPVIVAIDELNALLDEGEKLAGRFQADSVKPTFPKVEDWRKRMRDCARQKVLENAVKPKDLTRLDKPWHQADLDRITKKFVDHRCLGAHDSVGLAVFKHLWGSVERLKELIAKIEGEEAVAQQVTQQEQGRKRRATIIKIRDLAKSINESLNPDDYDLLGAVIKYSDEIASEDELKLIVGELQHEFGNPFELLEKESNNALNGEWLPFIEDARISLSDIHNLRQAFGWAATKWRHADRWKEGRRSVTGVYPPGKGLLRPLEVALQLEHGLIGVRVTNHNDSEARVEKLWISSVDAAGKKTIVENRVHEFKRCEKIPHVMPPHSSFEVTFRLSEGGFQTYGQSEYYAEVKIEDGSLFSSEHKSLTQPRSDDKPQPYFVETKSQDATETEISNAFRRKIDELISGGNDLLGRMQLIPSGVGDPQFNQWSQTCEYYLRDFFGETAVKLFRSPAIIRDNPIGPVAAAIFGDQWNHQRHLYERIASRITRLREIKRKVESGEFQPC
jgi:hypothetical protein